jgi:hypothetical protein
MGSIRVVKSRKLRWVGNIVFTEEMRNATKYPVGKLQEKVTCNTSHRGKDTFTGI